MNGLIHGGYMHFFLFQFIVVYEFWLSICIIFTVTYVTFLLQLLTEYVISLVLPLVYR